tara:strand:- start:311 stop:655 length:345 start_codon:yes stop_codon:yes gene_type:complete
MYSKEQVNRRNTRTWVWMNEDSRAEAHRRKFVDTHGGGFSRRGRYYVWEDAPEHKEPVKKTKSMYVFIRPDGIRDLVENFTKYCVDNELNKSTMFAVMRGSRPHHKGFTVRKLS